MNIFDNPNELVQKAEQLAKILANKKVKTHQLRRIYERVQYINETANTAGYDKVSSDIKLLKPQIAYAVSRKENLEPLFDQISVILDKVKSSKNVREFYDFFQSLMCYHRYYYKD